jgi:hypothetical protein
MRQKLILQRSIALTIQFYVSVLGYSVLSIILDNGVEKGVRIIEKNG